jgi:hypothetical protein
VSPPCRLGLSVAQTISCCMCMTNGWKQMIIGLPTMVEWESVGIWAIGLAQIGAHVGSPLRQNLKTRVPNIAI